MTSLRLFAAAMVILTLGCSAERPGVAPSSSESFAFVVLGDTPYTDEEEVRLNRLIDEINQEELAWVIHIGDIGRHSCSDSLFQARFELYQRIRHPFVYTPGDNEWTDCHQDFRGGFAPLERLDRLRALFFPDPSQSTGGRILSVTSQSQNPAYAAFVENARWVYEDIVFMTIHVVGSQNGLIDFPARTAADDSAYVRREAAAMAWLRSIRHPFVYTPGDNEWTDCHQDFRGGFAPLERLDRLRALFFPDPSQSTGGRILSVTSQSQNPAYAAFVENARWVYEDIVFMTIHVVGSQNGLIDFPARTAADDSAYVRREAAAMAWLRAGFAHAAEATSRAVVIAIHADPQFQAAAGSAARRGYDPFLAALEEEVAHFDGPVVLVHGDTHIYRIDTPLVDRRTGQRLENFTRIEVYGAPNVGLVTVGVDPASADLFSFQAKRMD